MPPALLTTELIRLDADLGATSTEVITSLTGLLGAEGRAADVATVAAAAHAREADSGTGVRGRVAIPHCRSGAVTAPTLAFARLSRPVDFGGPDGPADLVFFIATPAEGGRTHLKILSTLARALLREDFLTRLRTATHPGEVITAVTGVVSAGTATPDAAGQAPDPPAPTHLIAVTACPTGIAHTYLAAEALRRAAAERADLSLTIETQGSALTPALDPALIEAADAVIFATDTGVRDRARFVGKPLVDSGVRRAVNEPDALLNEAVDAAADPAARRVSATAGSEVGWGRRIRQAVMTGVSYMIPFVAAGGLLLALGFLFGGYDIAHGWQAIATGYSPANLPGHSVSVDGQLREFQRSGWALYVGAVLFATGQVAMGFIVPALSGFIAFALGGRPGIAPGFVGGGLSVLLGAGFIGGLVTGVLAGLLAHWIGTWRVPRVVRSLMPVVIIPLLASAALGLIMFLLLGRPLEQLMLALTQWLDTLSGSSAVALGVVLGVMMCFDLGGPVNKAAYLFATAGLATGNGAGMQVMAAVMAAGMVPPIAMSLATLLRRTLFTEVEQENGKSAWLLGLSFITEGAIPFAAADPLRVLPALMAGGAATGAVSMALGVESWAPHGGVFVLFALDPWWGLLFALGVGTAVSTVMVLAFKQFWPARTPQVDRAVAGSRAAA